MQKVTVGSMVEALCGKCNDVMGHTVVVMLGDAVAKVECRACGSVHRFRPAGRSAPLAKTAPAKERQPRTSRPAAPGSKAATALSRKEAAAAAASRERWATTVNRRKGDEPIAYAPAVSFAQGDLLQHPVFGLGEVIACIPPDKVDVLFEAGTKRLICNKG